MQTQPSNPIEAFHQYQLSHLLAAMPGLYLATVNDTECKLRIEIKDNKLGGVFVADGESLRVVGVVVESRTHASGVLLETNSSLPVAVFRLLPSPQGIELQIDLPECGIDFDFREAEKILFTRQEMALRKISG